MILFAIVPFVELALGLAGAFLAIIKALWGTVELDRHAAAFDRAVLKRFDDGRGNPGDEYRNTRHNVGFDFLDRLAQAKGVRFSHQAKFFGETARISTPAGDVWLLKPSTYMNLSGQAVQPLAAYYKISPEEILVVHDELDLVPGTMRLKFGGSNAGHNGLKDITQRLSTGDFWRLRVGIGHPRKLCPGMAVVDWVLGRMRKLAEGAFRTVKFAQSKVVDGFQSALKTLRDSFVLLGKFAHPPKPAKTEKTPEKKEPEAEA